MICSVTVVSPLKQVNGNLAMKYGVVPWSFSSDTSTAPDRYISACLFLTESQKRTRFPETYAAKASKAVCLVLPLNNYCRTTSVAFLVTFSGSQMRSCSASAYSSV